jgi:metal-responsive CopG/Arc/MetJ family transcriptional regulator
MLNPDKNRMLAAFNNMQKNKNPILVTLRIDEYLWTQFEDYAKDKGSDRSALIRKYISDCLKEEI